MELYGGFDSEKAYCVLWSAEVHECTAIQENIWIMFRNSALARSSITRCYQEYQARGDHSHIGEIRRPKISN